MGGEILSNMEFQRSVGAELGFQIFFRLGPRN